MVRLASLFALLIAVPLVAQPKEPAEAFAFDPQPKTLEPAPDARIIQALAYSPDGKHLAVAGEGGEIAIWNVADRKVAAKLAGHTDTVNALAWSKDGKLVSASSDKTAIVWNVETKKPRHTLKHLAPMYAVAISLDGKRIATGGFDKLIRLWDADTGTEKSKLTGHTASVRALAFNPNAEELASGGADYTIFRWQLTENKARELRGHTRPVRSIAYLSPGFLASGGDDGKLVIWNLADGEPRHTFGPYPEPVLTVAPSPKGSLLVAGLGNGKVYVLDPAEGQTRSALAGSMDSVTAVAVAPDGQQVAAGGFDKIVRLWSAGTKPALPEVSFPHAVPVRATAISPSGKVVATGSPDGTIRLFDAISGQEQASWPAHKGAVEDLSFSSDGSALISGGTDRRAKVWRPGTHELLHTLGDCPGPVRRVALSAKGMLAATASSDNDVRVHDLARGSMVRLNVEAPAVSLQFLADDGLLTAAGPRAYLWDVRETRVSDTLDNGQFARVTGAAGTADGKLFAIAGDPTPGTVAPQNIGNSRVLAVSRHHPTTVNQRMDDTGVGISRLALSPDGRVIAVVGGDSTVRVWEWPAVTPIRKFPSHAAAVLGLAVSNRGEFLVTASADGTARRWNASRGEPLLYAAKLLDESKQAWFARVSPDGKTLITGGDDKMLRVRDAVPGAFTTLPGEFRGVISSAVSPDGLMLATGHMDGSIRVWNLKANKLLKQLKGPAFPVNAIAFSPDGTRLVSGGGNYSEAVAGELYVWDTAAWKNIHSLAAHEQMIYDLAVSPDNKRIATASQDHSVRIWDLATGKEEHVLRMHAAAVKSVAFTKDGKRLYSGGFDGRIQWWDPESGKALDGRSAGVGAVSRLRLSPDGKSFALALNLGTNTGYPALWDIEKNEVSHKFPEHGGLVNDVAFTPDGRTLVSAGGYAVEVAQWEPGPRGPWLGSIVDKDREGKVTTVKRVPTSEIHCWDLETRAPLADLHGSKYSIASIQFTPDGSRLIVGSAAGLQPGELRICDFSGIRPKTVLAGSNGGLTCGRFSPDGSLFATGGMDGSLILWDVAKALAGDAAARRVIPAHTGIVRSLAWNTDGSRLVTSGEDGVVYVWDAKSGESVLKIAAADRPIYGVAVSPDGTMIATAAGDWKNKKNGQVRVWDAAKGTELFRLPDTDGPAWGVAFTADGLLIVDQTGDTAVRIFDVKTRKEIKSLTAPTDARGLTLSPDGKRFGITSQANGLVKIWEAGTWREAHELTAHPGKVVFTIEFATDGQTVLTAGGDGAAVIWKLPGGTWKLPSYVPPAPPQPQPIPNPLER